ncbi:MAG: hypothetical protein ACI9WC_002321, partial [Arenicella sp.]
LLSGSVQLIGEFAYRRFHRIQVVSYAACEFS